MISSASGESSEGRIALSIRQPWATLVVLGLKSIEIRRWSTKRRGEVFIHTGKLIDQRVVGWDLVPEEHMPLAELRGGIIGKARLVDCIAYRELDVFRRDAEKHRNLAEWFSPPVLHGFCFENAVQIPFEAVRGDLHFFRIP